MLKGRKTTRALAMILITMTMVTPVLIGMTANYSNHQVPVTTPNQQPRIRNLAPEVVRQKWNYSVSYPYSVECSPAIADVDGDGKLEVIAGYDYGVVALNGSGTQVHTYWHSEDPYYPESPVVADLLGNGKLEVLCVHWYYLYCYNASLDETEIWSAGNGYLEGTPAVGDLRGDGKLEVVIGDTIGNVFVFNATDGSQLWQYAPSGGGSIISSPTLADINGDGKLEILVHMSNSTGYDTLVCLDSKANIDGYLSPLWIYGMSYIGDTSESSPTVADLNNDGHIEIVVGSVDNNVYCVNSTGALQWKFVTGDNIHASPTVADIDGDGKMETLIGSNDHHFYCLNSNGQQKWNYTMGDIIYPSAAVADVDGDRMLDVLVGSYDSYLYCLSRTGGLEWKYRANAPILSSPTLADIDGDGKLEVLFGCSVNGTGMVGGFLYCLSVASAPVVPGAYPWPSIGYREDIRHSGCITDSDKDGLTDNYEITVGVHVNPLDPDEDAINYQSFLISASPLDDMIPPATIFNLAVIGQTNATITLTWTAPGDYGIYGDASGYVVKYSTAGMITAANWSSATTYTQAWTPAKSGTTETRTVTGLTQHTKYWFAVEAYDDYSPANYGGVSNSPWGRTLVTGWTNPPVTLIPGQGNNETMPSGSFEQYGFTMVTTNATDVVVQSGSSLPPGTTPPPSGSASFLYLDISGTQMSGTTGAEIYIFYNRTLVQSLGIDESTLQLHRWNSTLSEWVAIPSTVTFLNSTVGVIAAHLNHFSYFAVFGSAPSGTSSNPTTLILIVGGAIAAVAVVAVIIVLKKRSTPITSKTGKAQVVKSKRKK
jgi:hypothetical protein